MRTVVIGAGILGSAIAWQLARAGAEVTVIEAGQGPAGAATGASFGWINASFHLDADHYRLRVAGMEAWHALQHQLGLGDALAWPGALWWEGQREALARAEAGLRDLGYDVARLSRAEVAEREPALAHPPEVIGACTDVTYVAVMHSGITLAAITAELAAAEILGQPTIRTEMLAPYRPERF